VITGDEKYAVREMTEKRAEIVEWHENAFTMTDALGLCSRATLSTYAILPKDMANMYEAATGIAMTEEELTESARRVINLERFFNMREGVRREADTLPWRLMHEPMERPGGAGYSVNSPEEMKEMLDRYYELREWDETGLPKKETVLKYGLDEIIEMEEYYQ